MKKLEYFLFCIICISFLCSCSENGRHVDKNYVSFVFLVFRKKGLSDCCISGKGKKEHIIMQQNYNEKSIQHQFDAYCKKYYEMS